jgi:integrase
LAKKPAGRRNLRLTALHSFFRYAAFEVPDHSAQIQRVLAIPSKRFTRALVQFLTRAEVDALLAAPAPPLPIPADLTYWRASQLRCLFRRRPARHKDEFLASVDLLLKNN